MKVMTVLILTTLMCISSSSWIMFWVFMEVNMLMFCYLISKEKKTIIMKKESIMLYMVVQMTSSILMVSMVIKMESMNKTMMMMIMLLSMMKMGAWPLHNWYLKMISLLKMYSKSVKLLMTWQKLIPIIMLSYTMESMVLMTMLMGIMSIFMPAVMLKSKTSTKKIMALSSLNNNGWIMLICTSSVYLTIFMWSMYSASLTMMMMMMEKYKNKIYMMKMNLLKSYMVTMNLVGVPPLMMFWVKVMTIFSLISTGVSAVVGVLMMMGACYFAYNYMWMLLNSQMMMKKNNMMKMKVNSKVMWVLMMKTMSLTLMMK